MMSTPKGLSVLLAYFAALVAVTAACSEPIDWKAVDIMTRANRDDVDFVILGNVTEKTEPRLNRRFSGAVYTATVSVECVYKVAPQQTVYEEVKIVGFGETMDCTSTDVKVGQRYVFLMEPFQTQYAVVERNVQTAAELATEENTSDMFSRYGCGEPSEPTTPPPTTTRPTTIPPTTTELPTTAPYTTEMMTSSAKASKGETRDQPPPGSGGTAMAFCGALLATTLAFSIAFVF